MDSGAGKKRPPPVPAHIKYRTRTSRSGQEQETKMRPSEVIATLTQASLASSHPEVPPDGPQIVEFLDLQNTTTQTSCSVELDKPIFQPYPNLLKFPQYEPFGVYEQTLYFRNNDSVSRRIRVMPPDSPYFEVIGPRLPGKMRELEHSKIGPGMEVCFIVRFRPQEVKDYKVDLVCVTEREKFLVPVRLCAAAAAEHVPTGQRAMLHHTNTSTASALYLCPHSLARHSCLPCPLTSIVNRHVHFVGPRARPAAGDEHAGRGRLRDLPR